MSGNSFFQALEHLPGAKAIIQGGTSVLPVGSISWELLAGLHRDHVARQPDHPSQVPKDRKRKEDKTDKKDKAKKDKKHKTQKQDRAPRPRAPVHK